MCEAAPRIIDLLDRMGVAPRHTPKRELARLSAFRRALYHRTAFAGATTGQQQCVAAARPDKFGATRPKAALRKKREAGHFSPAVIGLKTGESRAASAQWICASMEVEIFHADAVIFCTRRRTGAIFGRSTNSVVCTGSAQSALFQQGVDYANGVFHSGPPDRDPQAKASPFNERDRRVARAAASGFHEIPRRSARQRNGCSLMPELLLLHLEEWYPKYGNLVLRDIVDDARFCDSCIRKKLGPAMVKLPFKHLDVTHIPRRKRSTASSKAFSPFTRNSPASIRPGRTHESFPRHALHDGRHAG